MARRIAVDLSVLRESRDLRLLILGEAVRGLGTQAALVAIPFQVYTLTHSAALVGLLGIVELVPIVVGSLLGGAIADRIDRRRLMFAAQAAIARRGAALAAVRVRRRSAGRAGLRPRRAAGRRLDASTTSPARRSSPRSPGDRLRAALSLNYGVYQLAAVIGPGLGGLVIAGVGVGAAYAADARRLRGDARRHARAAAAAAGADRRRAPADRGARSREGLRFVRRNRALMGSFAIDLVAMTFGMPRALFAVLALTVFDAGASGTGAALRLGVGRRDGRRADHRLGRARALARADRDRRGRSSGALAIAAAGLMPSLWPAAALLLAVAGAADSVSAVCRTIINQTATPEAHARADVGDLHARGDERAAARRPRVRARRVADRRAGARS